MERMRPTARPDGAQGAEEVVVLRNERAEQGGEEHEREAEYEGDDQLKG